MSNKIIDEYYSDDKLKKAVINRIDDNYYAIDFFEKEKYTHSIAYPNNSINYVSDAAENYVLGYFTSIRDSR
jgi:hypothetical protein